MPNFALPTDLSTARTIPYGAGKIAETQIGGGAFRQMVLRVSDPSTVSVVLAHGGTPQEMTHDQPSPTGTEVPDDADQGADALLLSGTIFPPAEPLVMGHVDGLNPAPQIDGPEQADRHEKIGPDLLAKLQPGANIAELLSVHRERPNAQDAPKKDPVPGIPLPLAGRYIGPLADSKLANPSRAGARPPSPAPLLTEMPEFPESLIALKPGFAVQASGHGRLAQALAAPQDFHGLRAHLDELVPSWPRSGQKNFWNQPLPFAASPTAMLETALKNGSMPSVPEHVLASAHDAQESPTFANAIGNVQSGTSQILAPALTPQMAQSTVAQVAQAIWQAPNDHVDLVLSPDELGRVRIQMQHSEAGLQVLIATDRPETLDLLRKNIALLSRALSDLGYGSAQFHFGEQGHEQQGRQAMTGLSFAQSEAASLPAMTSATPPRHSGSSGLDLRF